MNTGAKIILASACILLGALMFQMEVNGQMTVPDSYCNSTEANITMGWDNCYQQGPGVFKSKSICYRNNVTMRYVYRYDFYQCIPFKKTYILIPKNCSQPTAPADVNRTMVCNRYNEATRTCSGTCPDFSAMMMTMG